MFCYRVLGCRVSGFQCWGSGFRRSHSDNPGDACLKRYIYIYRHADNDHHDHDGFESSSLRIRRSCTSFRTVLLSSFTSVSKFSTRVSPQLLHLPKTRPPGVAFQPQQAFESALCCLSKCSTLSSRKSTRLSRMANQHGWATKHSPLTC